MKPHLCLGDLTLVEPAIQLKTSTLVSGQLRKNSSVSSRLELACLFLLDVGLVKIKGFRTVRLLVFPDID